MGNGDVSVEFTGRVPIERTVGVRKGIVGYVSWVMWGKEYRSIDTDSRLRFGTRLGDLPTYSKVSGWSRTLTRTEYL